ncbi:MAG: hypothetical protein JNJ83_12150 [Verrucomicrobiaceae bacterium]|nr:hypothetical protein [Verrucomicrobiaceae bacterium]
MKTLLALLILATAAPTLQAGYCAPYVVSTCVVCSRTECRYAYDHCGRPFSYEVRVVTYRAYYNTGTTITFTKTYRA